MHHAGARPAAPVLLPLIPLQSAASFPLEQRQTLPCHVRHGTEVDVDIGSVTLKQTKELGFANTTHGIDPYLIGSHLDIALEVPGIQPRHR